MAELARKRFLNRHSAQAGNVIRVTTYINPANDEVLKDPVIQVIPGRHPADKDCAGLGLIPRRRGPIALVGAGR